ncbi:hypothetical protein [Streptomyces sp. DH10]|nr:hypothetical protein [Streptomyces sp. DH10]MDG9710490.1 hypothetical protein [Streptomyces sp. DH10]
MQDADQCFDVGLELGDLLGVRCSQFPGCRSTCPVIATDSGLGRG